MHRKSRGLAMNHERENQLASNKKEALDGLNLNQRMFLEIEHCLLEQEEPSKILDPLSETKEFQASAFGRMNQMKETEQSKQHHPEGHVWIHTMMVVDEAAKVRNESKDPRVFMWSAFLHDIGKPEVTRLRKGKITAYNHDKVGAEKTEELLNQVCEDSEFIKQVSAMVRWHMQILFIAKSMALADLKAMKREVDIDEVALLGMCDRLGRLGVERNKVMRDVAMFQKKAKEIE